jgi:hypothetical protein
MNTKELATLIQQTTRACLYESRYFSNPMHYAQDQLTGRTHYVDDSTLRYFHARVVGAHNDADGLLFWIVESSAKDPDNSARGFRPVVFDIFGEVVFRLNLADMVKTSDKARALYRDWLESFDIVAHYREALESRAKRLESEARQYREALQALEPVTA